MRIAWLAILLAAPAAADGEQRLDVELGKAVSVKVGYARGWMCDDPSLVDADLATRDDHNVWTVTGKKLGHTLCRVGTEPYTPVHFVFDLHVVKAKRR